MSSILQSEIRKIFIVKNWKIKNISSWSQKKTILRSKDSDEPKSFQFRKYIIFIIQPRATHVYINIMVLSTYFSYYIIEEAIERFPVCCLPRCLFWEFYQTSFQTSLLWENICERWRLLGVSGLSGRERVKIIKKCLVFFRQRIFTLRIEF